MRPGWALVKTRCRNFVTKTKCAWSTKTGEGWKFARRVLHPLMPIRSEGLHYAAAAAGVTQPT
ncbi:MAG: hypothetical protein JWL97_3958 [Gemmatimonadales bacterium]|nr:hypothetical protein [Gemmatimonadales bacterium]